MSLTRAVYHAIGADLAGLGINFNLAPCADVLGAADSPAVGTRSFGTDTDLVSRHTTAAVTGLQGAGVAACTKHFPGHGRTGTDYARGASPPSRVAWPSYASATCRPSGPRSGPGPSPSCPATCAVPELTGDLPATVSSAALADLLRGELGFTGVIVSDALEMRATRDMFGVPRAAVLAVAAGTDLLCLGRDSDEEEYLAVRGALVAAVRDGTITGTRLEEAADRVARLRGGLARTRSVGFAGASRGSGASGASGAAGPVLDGVGLARGPARGSDVGAAVRARPAADHRGRAAGERRGRALRLGTGPVGTGRKRPPGRRQPRP